MALKKPTQFFNEEVNDEKLPEKEVDINFTQELTKIESLSNQVFELQKDLSQKVVKNDLESMVLSQINFMKENFEILKFDLKKSNRENIGDITKKIFELTNIVDNLIQIEIPRYKNRITKSELFVGEQIKKIESNLSENSTLFQKEINDKFLNVVEVVDNNIQQFNKEIEESSIQVKRNSEIYRNLSKILEAKIVNENEKFEQYSNSIEHLSQSFEQLSAILKEELLISSQLVKEQIEEHKQEIENRQIDLKKFVVEDLNDHKNLVNQSLEDQHKQILDVKSEVVISEKHIKSLDKQLQEYNHDLVQVKEEININEQNIKSVDKYLQEYHQELVQVKEEVFSEIENLSIGNLQENIERLEKKIDFIKETYSKIEPEVIVQEVIKESNFAEPPKTKNSDPLTPLNQNFVTLEQLQQHYRLFINRIQQQISTLGGGGETQLKYLDDVVGIATNPSAYDGKYLKYNHSLGKFEFVAVSGGGESYWSSNVSGISTTANVGIGTTNPTVKFQVIGNASVSGVTTSGLLNVGVGGTILTTVGVGNTTYVGIGSTQPTALLDINAPSGYSGNSLSLPLIGFSTIGQINIGRFGGDSSGVNGYFFNQGPAANQRHGMSTRYAGSSNGIAFWASNSALAGIANNSFFVSQVLGFTGGSPISTDPDSFLYRDSANVLAQRNAGIGQTFRLYNTYTSASQYERAYLGWNNNVFQIGVDTAGISTARPISLVGAAGSNTGDTLQPLQINQTWTAGTGIATAITLNVTNTSSSGSSNLLDLRIGGVGKHIVDTGGAIYCQGTLQSSKLSTKSDGYEFYIGSTAAFASDVFTFVLTNGTLNTRGRFSISNDVFLERDAAGTFAQRNSTNAQTFRVYKTYTSATNFERANVGWTTNTFIVGTEKGSAGGTARQLELQTDGTTRVAITTTGLVGIGTTNPTSTLQVDGNTLISGITTVGLANTSTPPSNSQMSFELISNTQLRIKVRGTDGVLRSADITLA